MYSRYDGRLFYPKIQVVNMPEEKKEPFSWYKVLIGIKRPLIALVAALAANLLGVPTEGMQLIVGVLIERAYSQLEYAYMK